MNLYFSPSQWLSQYWSWLMLCFSWNRQKNQKFESTMIRILQMFNHFVVFLCMNWSWADVVSATVPLSFIFGRMHCSNTVLLPPVTDWWNWDNLDLFLRSSPQAGFLYIFRNRRLVYMISSNVWSFMRPAFPAVTLLIMCCYTGLNEIHPEISKPTSK